MGRSVFIGFDPREAAAFAVARNSARRNLNGPWPIRGIVLEEMRRECLYNRPTSRRAGVLWDEISEAPMSTEFAISRFLTPILARRRGWALFMDADVLVRGNLGALFELADPSKAVQVVKHDFRPPESVKMDGQAQLPYARKNWSSVMLWNCEHPANQLLTLDLINSAPGRDLHAFCWLDDELIGELPTTWNWLVGHSPPDPNPRLVHFTDGFPLMAGYEDQPFADEWRAELVRWAEKA